MNNLMDKAIIYDQGMTDDNEKTKKKKSGIDKTKKRRKEKEDRLQGKIDTFFTPTRKPGEGAN